MTIDNGKTIIRLRLNVFIATVLFIIYLFFAYFGKSIRFPLFGFTDTQITLALVAIYLFVAFYPMIFRFNYIYFSDDGPAIILRYYSVGLVKGKKRSIEIEKSRFTGFKKSGSLFLSKIELIQKLDKRDAVYPPVYLTSLKKSEKKSLYEMLSRYTQGT